MKNSKVAGQCFAVNLILGILVIAPFIIKDGGMFTLGTDYDAYQIPMYNLLREKVLSGDVFWNWNLDLGTDFVGGSSFLILGSPFFWLTLLFYKVDYLYLGGWMFILKYAVAGATSGLFLNRFLTNKKSVVIGSILYAFSGFQAVNLMMGSFHDAVALFPLMLYGLEKLLTEQKKGIFALTVCINAMTNYYLFIGETIFIIIYFLVRFVWEKKAYFKSVGKCIFEGILGILMAGVIFYPSIIFILQNPRSNGIMSVSEWLLPDRRYLLKVLRSFFFPGEMMQKWSCVMEYDWSSSSAYLPMVGMTLVLCYIWKKRREKDWLKRILIVSIVFMVVPLLCSVFTLMTDVYCRWYYMPILLFALASAKVIEEREGYLVGRISILLSILMVVVVIGFEWWNRNRFQVIFVENVYWILTICGILGVVLTGIFASTVWRNSMYYSLWFAGVVLFSLFTNAYTCNLYQDVRGYESLEYKERLEAMEELGSMLDMTKQPYRLGSSDNIVSMTARIPAVGAFSNTVQDSIFELWSLMGEERRVYCPEVSDDFEELTGVRYYVTSSPTLRSDLKLIGSSGTNKQYYLYEKDDSRTIGTLYKYYINERDLLNLSADQREKVMLNALVVNDEEAIVVRKLLAKYESSVDAEELAGIGDFNRNNKGFSCEFNSPDNGYLMISVPYSDSWSVTVNGTRKEILSAGGLMAVEVDESINSIEFEYYNKNVMVGLIMSVMALGVLIIEKVYRFLHKNYHKEKY